MIERTLLGYLGLGTGRHAKAEAFEATEVLSRKMLGRCVYSAVAMVILVLGVVVPANGQNPIPQDERFISVTNMQGTFTVERAQETYTINFGAFYPNSPTRFDPPFFVNTIGGGVFYLTVPTETTGVYTYRYTPMAIFADLGDANVESMRIVGEVEDGIYTPGSCHSFWNQPFYKQPNLYAWFSYPSTGVKTIKLTALECESINGQLVPTSLKVAEATWTFEVTPPPQLSLFLDVDGIDLTNPINSDDAVWYVPCSIGTGASVPPAQLPQVITVVAAYLNSSLMIVTPPTTENASLVLSEVSALKGIAMNTTIGSRDTLPDFEPVTTTASFGTDKTARFTVNCWDYGGFARATVTHGSGGPLGTATMHLPEDPGFNWIPDAGWRVFDAQGSHVVPDNFQVPNDDVDNVPNANAFTGDGLSRFEEYRGFVTKGVHVRTDPMKKDVFIYTDFMLEGIGDAQLLPLVIHQIDPNEMSSPGARLIAPNFQNLGYPSADIPGHFVGTWPAWLTSAQQAVGVFRDTVTLSINAGFGSTDVPDPGGPPWAVKPAGSKVHETVIRVLSPTSKNKNVEDKAYDLPKTKQTIAHEVGHAVGIHHVEKMPNFSCAAPSTPANTVMIILYYPTTNPLNSPSCAWNNIPHQYTTGDLSNLRIK